MAFRASATTVAQNSAPWIEDLGIARELQPARAARVGRRLPDGYVAAMNADPLIAGESQPFATMAAIVRADERLKQDLPRITTPLIILHGTADKAAKPSGSEHFHERAGSSDKTLKLYEGRFHDPLNDVGKKEVLSEVLSWLDQR